VRGFLLDTNVISELIRAKPEPRVVAWIEAMDERLLYLSVLTMGEIRKGVASLPQRSRRTVIEAWLETDLRVRFSGRILPIDEGVANRWGQIAAEAATRKRLLPVIDGLLAATALQNNLTLVTRNVKDVSSAGVQIHDPWRG